MINIQKIQYVVGHSWHEYSSLYLREDGDYSADVSRAILFASRKDLVAFVRNKSLSKIKSSLASSYFIRKLMFDTEGRRTMIYGGDIKNYRNQWIKYAE